MIPLPPLSHTNLNDYEICPRRFHHKHILKDCPREEKSKAQLDGTAVHEAFKKRLKLQEKLSKTMEGYESIAHNIEELKALRGCTLLVEQKLGVKEDGTACDFFDSAVWLRGVLDVALTDYASAWIGDWKTGKVREDPTELKIFSLLLKAHYPSLKSVTGNYIWLKEMRLGPCHPLSDTEHLWTRIKETAENMKNRLIGSLPWPADEGPLCAYCPVSREQCEYKR